MKSLSVHECWERYKTFLLGMNDPNSVCNVVLNKDVCGLILAQLVPTWFPFDHTTFIPTSARNAVEMHDSMRVSANYTVLVGNNGGVPLPRKESDECHEIITSPRTYEYRFDRPYEVLSYGPVNVSYETLCGHGRLVFAGGEMVWDLVSSRESTYDYCNLAWIQTLTDESSGMKVLYLVFRDGW